MCPYFPGVVAGVAILTLTPSKSGFRRVRIHCVGLAGWRRISVPRRVEEGPDGTVMVIAEVLGARGLSEMCGM